MKDPGESIDGEQFPSPLCLDSYGISLAVFLLCVQLQNVLTKIGKILQCGQLLSQWV